jgi:hypothetical protein
MQIKGSKAPAGPNIGNIKQPLSIFSPSESQLLVGSIKIYYYYTPLGLKRALAIVYYRYFAPLVLFEPLIRINIAITKHLLQNKDVIFFF